MRSYVLYAAWTLLAGAGIPLIGVLNSGIARSVGNPFTRRRSCLQLRWLWPVGLTLPLYGYPRAAQLASVPPVSYAAGLFIGFYALSATIIIRAWAQPAS